MFLFNFVHEKFSLWYGNVIIMFLFKTKKLPLYWKHCAAGQTIDFDGIPFTIGEKRDLQCQFGTYYFEKNHKPLLIQIRTVLLCHCKQVMEHQKRKEYVYKVHERLDAQL